MNTETQIQTEPAQAFRDWMQKHGVTVQFRRAGVVFSSKDAKSRLEAQFHFPGTVRKGDKFREFEYSGGYLAFLDKRARAEIANGKSSSIRSRKIASEIIGYNAPGYLDAPEVRLSFQSIYDLSKPDAASFLICLKLDSDCLNMDFEEWAENYGYDKDSREAERTFNACRENSRALRDILGRDAFAELLQLESL